MKCNCTLYIRTDPSTPVGKIHPAGVSDITVEAAMSSIMDCEDSVTAVDAEDKLLVYTVRHVVNLAIEILYCVVSNLSYSYVMFMYVLFVHV